VNVINLSMSGLTATAEELVNLENRVRYAHSHGINVVASAGNDGSDMVSYPARLAGAFGVGAADTRGRYCSFSNHGDGMDLAALGCEAVTLAGVSGQTITVNGTSFSTPIVAAVLDALRSYRTDLSPQDAEALLTRTAQRTPQTPVVDAEAAFRAAGLVSLIDDYEPPLDPTRTKPVGGSLVMVDTRVVEPLRLSRPRPPRVLRRSIRGGRQTIKLQRPEAGCTAIFAVRKRRYRRASGTLVLRTRAWLPAVAIIEDEWGQTSRRVTVHEPSGRGNRRNGE
jgi:subtilisin family serine protease